MKIEIIYDSDRSREIMQKLESANLDLDLILVRGDRVTIMVDQQKPKIKRKISKIFGKVLESQLGGYSNLDKGIDLPNNLWVYDI
jgi:hypothetical protein